jgi:hypothetical protein
MAEAADLNKMILEARTKRKNEALAEKVFSRKPAGNNAGIKTATGTGTRPLWVAPRGMANLLGNHRVSKYLNRPTEQARREQARFEQLNKVCSGHFSRSKIVEKECFG